MTVRGLIEFDVSEMANLANVMLPKHTASILFSNVVVYILRQGQISESSDAELRDVPQHEDFQIKIKVTTVWV